MEKGIGCGWGLPCDHWGTPHPPALTTQLPKGYPMSLVQQSFLEPWLSLSPFQPPFSTLLFLLPLATLCKLSLLWSSQHQKHFYQAGSQRAGRAGLCTISQQP